MLPPQTDKRRRAQSPRRTGSVLLLHTPLHKIWNPAQCISYYFNTFCVDCASVSAPKCAKNRIFHIMRNFLGPAAFFVSKLHKICAPDMDMFSGPRRAAGAARPRTPPKKQRAPHGRGRAALRENDSARAGFRKGETSPHRFGAKRAPCFGKGEPHLRRFTAGFSSRHTRPRFGSAPDIPPPRPQGPARR